MNRTQRRQKDRDDKRLLKLSIKNDRNAFNKAHVLRPNRIHRKKGMTLRKWFHRLVLKARRVNRSA